MEQWAKSIEQIAASTLIICIGFRYRVSVSNTFLLKHQTAEITIT
jgi:hypothetical protein